jgi:hypothetical protein
VKPKKLVRAKETASKPKNPKRKRREKQKMVQGNFEKEGKEVRKK